MSENELIEKINRELPETIDGFQRRIGVFDHLSNLMYSKDGSYLGNHLTGSIYRDNEKTPLEHFAKNVLYDVVGKDIEDALMKMKEKLELNKRVRTDFIKNIMFGFNPNFEYSNQGHKHFLKLFEAYLVLDLDSDSQFFCITTINPIFDIIYILPILKTLKKQIEEQNFIKLAGEDFNYEEFYSPRTIHLYSFDFGQKKDEIRMLFKKEGWNIKFRDKYLFDKQDADTLEKIVLCEGYNYKILNELKLPKTVFSQEHNSYSIFQNAKAGRYCLRDKDFLLENERSRLKKMFPRYYILKYYCIENYLFHPDNIAELNISGFNKNLYIQDITHQKNLSLFEIVSSFKMIRKSYKELTENFKIEVKNADSILIEELKSDHFETFYKHFDMKILYKKNYLENFGLTESKLASTDWFKSQIISLLSD